MGVGSVTRRAGRAGGDVAVASRLLLLLVSVPAAVVVVVACATGYGPVLLFVVIAAPFVVMTLRRPQLGFLLLVALAPFDGLRLLVEVPVVGAAWKFVLGAIVLLATFVCPASARARRGRRLPSWSIPLFGLAFIGLASAAYVGNVQGLVGLKLDFAYVLVAWAVWRCPLDARERDRLVTILMGTGAVVAVFGVYQQVIGPDAVHALGYGYDTSIRFIGDSFRAFSTFENAPAFAMYVMIVLLIGIPVALSDTKRARNRCFLVLTPLYFLGLGAAFSRSSLVGLGVGLVFLGFRRYRIVLAALPLVLVGFLVFGGNVTETLSSSSSLNDRTTGWEENLAQVSGYPLGAGIGAVGSAAETVIELHGLEADRYQPDNYYFKTLYELGVLGLWMLALVMIAGLVSTAKIADLLRGRDRALADGISAQIVAAIAAAFFTSYLEIFPMDFLFWTLLALGATMRPGDGGVADADAIDVTSRAATARAG